MSGLLSAHLSLLLPALGVLLFGCTCISVTGFHSELRPFSLGLQL